MSPRTAVPFSCTTESECSGSYGQAAASGKTFPLPSLLFPFNSPGVSLRPGDFVTESSSVLFNRFVLGKKNPSVCQGVVMWGGLIVFFFERVSISFHGFSVKTQDPDHQRLSVSAMCYCGDCLRMFGRVFFVTSHDGLIVTLTVSEATNCSWKWKWEGTVSLPYTIQYFTISVWREETEKYNMPCLFLIALIFLWQVWQSLVLESLPSKHQLTQ
ncbi:hypothetical protein JZ751_021967 [Albula glossodonta]|uniref:Uncharacterized protein n=1 Tax=Albula glossodonta TaxID=121402 RepID=A0A8T2NLE7_9TELE|nr:hypothetical protein JZ751_021967 [Albula glossodonta]